MRLWRRWKPRRWQHDPRYSPHHRACSPDPRPSRYCVCRAVLGCGSCRAARAEGAAVSSITLLTSAGAVRVAGEGLVIDIRNMKSAQPFDPKASEPADSLSELMSVMFPETPANPSAPQARQATAAGEAPSSASPATHSAPSKAETGRAGGPVCAPVTLSDPAERHPARSVSSAFVSSQPAGSVGVPHSKQHKSGKLKDQPANLSDPRDPGPIPSFMDKRAKKDAA